MKRVHDQLRHEHIRILRILVSTECTWSQNGNILDFSSPLQCSYHPAWMQLQLPLTEEHQYLDELNICLLETRFHGNPGRVYLLYQSKCSILLSSIPSETGIGSTQWRSSEITWEGGRDLKSPSALISKTPRSGRIAGKLEFCLRLSLENGYTFSRTAVFCPQ